MSEEKASFWFARKYRPHRIGLVFLILFLATEIGFRIYFAHPGIIERNPGSTIVSMPYLLDQMARWKGRKVVFIGSSVTQGYGNCKNGQAFPALIEKELRRKYGMKDVKVFNLSSAGNRFGDHFGNLMESEQYKPDLVVTAVHVKLFSVSAALVSPYCHDEVMYYFRNDPEYAAAYRKKFAISDERYRQIWLDFQVRKFSAIYRYRGLFNYLLIGDFKVPSTSASDKIRATMNWMDPILVEAYLTTPEERNADYLWKVIPKHVVLMNKQQCEAFDFSDENTNWLTFKDYCAYGEQKGIKMLFFINPLNMPFNEQYEFFPWKDVMDQFKRSAFRVIQSSGHMVVDATGQIDYKYFSDFDHLNMNGHRQMAKFLMPKVLEALQKR